MGTPLSQLAEAILIEQLDAGPGLNPAPPNGDAPTLSDWLEKLLRTVERRAERILQRGRQRQRQSAKISLASKQAQSALNLCRAVRNACSIEAPVEAATAAMIAVSQLWRAEDANALTENARKAARAALKNNPIQRAKEEVKWFWWEYSTRKYPKMRTNEQFAIEVLRRWPELTSLRVVLTWCTEWKKEVKRFSSTEHR
jgi:hypothetical protein